MLPLGGLCSKRIFRNDETYFLTFQRADAPALAISRRRSEDNAFALAAPPFGPPRLPRALMTRLTSSGVGSGIGLSSICPVAILPIREASSKGSFGREGRFRTLELGFAMSRSITYLVSSSIAKLYHYLARISLSRRRGSGFAGEIAANTSAGQASSSFRRSARRSGAGSRRYAAELRPLEPRRVE